MLLFPNLLFKGKCATVKIIRFPQKYFGHELQNGFIIILWFSLYVHSKYSLHFCTDLITKIIYILIQYLVTTFPHFVKRTNMNKECIKLIFEKQSFFLPIQTFIMTSFLTNRFMIMQKVISSI